MYCTLSYVIHIDGKITRIHHIKFLGNNLYSPSLEPLALPLHTVSILISCEAGMLPVAPQYRPVTEQFYFECHNE